jgi:hypothetical protein
MGDGDDVAGGTAGDGGSKQPQAEEEAAQLIQRNYRGYRERRQLKGIGLDASARWAEVGDHPHAQHDVDMLTVNRL